MQSVHRVFNIPRGTNYAQSNINGMLYTNSKTKKIIGSREKHSKSNHGVRHLKTFLTSLTIFRR